MRAAVVTRPGGPEVLLVREVPDPEPGPDEVLVAVKASALNRADLIQRAGNYPASPDAPADIPGLEMAGVVALVGPRVRGIAPGDRVMALLGHGGFAEQAVALESDCFAVPDDMDDDTAATFMIGYISSHVAIRWQAKLEPGETLLVLGAAGGVGLTAIEIGKALGATVIAGASSTEKLEIARQHGADQLINYKSTSLKKSVAELTDGKGANVCYDPVGGDLFDEALSSLAWGGRILVIGFVGGIPKIPANRLLVKNRSAMGSSLRYYREHRPDQLRASVEELIAWWRDGKLKPLISQRFSLENVPAAMAELLERRAVGRIVIAMA